MAGHPQGYVRDPVDHAAMEGTAVNRCAACKTPVDEPPDLPLAERHCPVCGLAERELLITPPPALARAEARAPVVDIEPLLDSVALAHLGIVATLATASGFGVGTVAESAWWGLASAVVTGAAWWSACHWRASRRVLIRVARSFTP